MKDLSRILTVCVILALVPACGAPKTVADHIERAQQLLGEGENDAAILELKNALQKGRDVPIARWLLGKAYLDNGTILSAEKELLLARDLGWPDDDVVPALAKVFFAQGKYSEIRKLRTRTLREDVQGPVIALQALAEFSLGKKDKAKKLMTDALRKSPSDLDVFLAHAELLANDQDLDGSLAVLQTVFEVDPENGRAWSLQADVKLYRGELADARDAYSKAIEYKRNSFRERLQRGFLNLQLEDVESAQADVDELLIQAPQHEGSNYLAGLLYFRDGNHAAAVAAFTLAEPAYREFPLVLYYLANSNLVLGDVEKAKNLIQQFTELVPEHIAGRKVLASIRLREGRHQEVVDLMAQVLVDDPNDTGALNLTANAFLKLDLVDRGIALLTRIVELEPDSVSAKVRLGAGLLAGGRDRAATQQIESALELDPEFQQAEILLVLNHLQRKDYDKAISAAKAFSRRNLLDAMPHNLLGRVYLLAGNTQEAIRAFESVVARDKGEPSANHSLAQLELARGDMASARGRYEAILSHYPNRLPAMLELAKIEAREQRGEQLEALLKTAMRAHPSALAPRMVLGRYYLSAGQADLIAPLFVSLDPKTQAAPQVLQLLAMSQLSSRENRKAQTTLKQLDDHTVDSADSHHQMALASAGSGDPTLTRRQLLKALELDRNHAPSLLAMAKLALIEKSFGEFDQYLERLRSVISDSADVYHLSAISALRAGDSAAAADFAKRAYLKVPTTQTMLEFGVFLEKAGRVDEAQKLRDEWLVRHESDVRARLDVAGRMLSGGNTSAALQHYTKILELDPDNVVALNNLSWELRTEDPSQALIYARRAAELNPDSAEIVDTLAVVEHFNKNRDRARRGIGRAVIMLPGNPTVKYHHAMIGAAAGDKNTAIINLQELLQDHASFPERESAVKLLAELQ
ncbi:MAG: XrtA/PEP-CTERM system TPR-repeat protein PrsT [Halioglobus sp.]